MIKCKGYYTEPTKEIDYEYYERMAMQPPEPTQEIEMIETTCYISENDIQAIFDTEDGKCVVYYTNGWDVLIKNEKAVLDQLI